MDAAEAHSHNEWYKPHESDPQFRAFADASADEELSPAAEAALERAAACDDPIWVDALRHARILGLAVDKGAIDLELGNERAWALDVGRHLECGR